MGWDVGTDIYGLGFTVAMKPFERILSRGRVVLGPMSGYSCLSYRRFMEPFGVGASVTEMTSAPGLVHNPEESRRFVTASGIAPTGAQVFGANPEIVAEGATIAMELEPRLDFIDINMGCPVKKVRRTGAGSALMRDPKLCGRIVGAVKDAVDIPVTVKIRLGEDAEHMNFREVLDETLSAGADAVTVHSRTVDQQYSGTADHDMIRGLGDEIDVPLIVSGDIFSPQDALKAMDITKADAVMVARGGVGNPFLITAIDTLLKTGEVLPEPPISQYAEWCLELMDATVSEFGPEVGLARMRGVAPKFLSGGRYSRNYRHAITSADSDLESIRALLMKVRDADPSTHP